MFGVVQRIELLERNVTPDAGMPPNRTSIWPVFSNPEPVSVTVCVSVRGPEFGDTLDRLM